MKNLAQLLGMFSLADKLTGKSTYQKKRPDPAVNPGGVQVSYIQVTPKSDKKPFQIPVIDATLSEDNRILAKQIIKASNGNRSKYF